MRIINWKKLQFWAHRVVLFILIVSFLPACSQPTDTPYTPLPSVVENNPTVKPTDPPVSLPPTPTNQPLQPTATLPEATLDPTPMVISPTTPVLTSTVVLSSELGIVTSRISEIDGMEQVFVPAGEFIMGTTDPEAKQTEEGGRAYPEIPQHTVYLDNYWIDKFEVTNGQYALCVQAGACEPPWDTQAYSYPRYYGNPDFDNYPVIWVSYFQARTYCNWAGRRLPSEAEWEKASRGTEGAKYPWGNAPLDGTRANFCDVNCTRSIANDWADDGYADIAPVGSYPAGASPYGAMDMSGNVWEWVNSLIAPYPFDPNDGRENLADLYGERAWRGGPFSNGYWWMRSSVRYRSVPNYKWNVLGFRCASSE